MIPDVDLLDATLANQRADWISLGFRGVSQQIGDRTTAVPNGARWLNRSPYEQDEYGVPRAYVQLTTTANEDVLADAMDQATLDLINALAGGNANDVHIASRDRNGLGNTYHLARTM